MIMWDREHGTELIIEICDGHRPPIVTNAPKGYIELMKECWHSDPNQRPTAIELFYRICVIEDSEIVRGDFNPTKIIKSPDIGPIARCYI
ncbi:hypothetical protein C1646_700991 [Rhizophagus diaphanus]|nr:hypothetical protein C1646_700991 [Rhizophagus diaphanus] [Rhizophagus sp. MUCL 43196]